MIERDTVWVVTNALGHTRIDTSITSYLKYYIVLKIAVVISGNV